jgi:hypothetical protein
MGFAKARVIAHWSLLAMTEKQAIEKAKRSVREFNAAVARLASERGITTRVEVIERKYIGKAYSPFLVAEFSKRVD